MNKEMPCKLCPSFAICKAKVKAEEQKINSRQTGKSTRLDNILNSVDIIRSIKFDATKHLCINTVILSCDIMQYRWLTKLKGIDNTKQFKRKLINLYFNEE